MAQPQPWPQTCMRAFIHASQEQFNKSQYAFYGPYMNLLYTLLGVQGSYYVEPEVPRPEGYPDYPVLDSVPGALMINLTQSEVYPGALFTVLLNHKHPVFFIQLNPPFALSYPERRADAHEQMETHFDNLVMYRERGEGLITPSVPAVSVFGTKMCFYELDAVADELVPSMPEVPPIERWDCDILEEEGAARFREVVESVMEQCHAHEE